MRNPGRNKLSRCLKAFIEVDEFDLANLTVKIGHYYYNEPPSDFDRDRRLYWCHAHSRAVVLTRYRGDPIPWSSTAQRGCQRAQGACVMAEIALETTDKDLVEIWHRQERIRHWYIYPNALRDDEDIEAYRLLRERGDDPDTARNSVLGLGHKGVDRLLAQLRQQRKAS